MEANTETSVCALTSATSNGGVFDRRFLQRKVVVPTVLGLQPEGFSCIGRSYCLASSSFSPQSSMFIEQSGSRIGMSGNGMAFCPHCGKAIPGGVRFCPSCGKALPAIAQPPQSSSQPAQSTMSQSKSHTGRNVGALFVLVLLFFFLPVVPYTFASYSFLGTNAQATGSVSLSFVLLHCGMVVNVQASGSFLGSSVGSYSYGNPGFVCNGSG